MKLLKLVPDDTQIGFVRWRFVGVGVTALLVILSVVGVMTKGLSYGVDFAGGLEMQVEFQNEFEIDEVRGLIDGLDRGASNISEFGEGNAISIRLPVPESEDDEAVQRTVSAVLAALETRYPNAELLAQDVVSGKVSDELIRDGILAAVIAMIGVAAYIWLRFEWQFGVGALIALVHDVLIALGLFAWTGLEFDLNIVAALLTIIGYSLNDTIVNYDRIRENLRKYRKMKMIDLLDLSINEMLARTVMTSLTMAIALGALLAFGGPVLFGFTLAMLLGVVVGTYSSIYVAGPVLLWLGVGPNSFLPPETGNAERVEARS
ncbi:protein translocase subunit SecF [Pacificimonas flava]|uniref:Protein-export membrane protein SecF n=2 Tax=Pacificimonas TaxID=1960290 RepID=A0A219B6T5_9SPHN|nr:MULTISPECIES: protein translocase subunit SecF [Pacificimonas]MBZ6378652.1 protein translocase subunit SecF [Pacificimonas aurantium]OWV34077.1 protein translocase subunit SecF [Pacificimonas flava]